MRHDALLAAAFLTALAGCATGTASTAGPAEKSGNVAVTPGRPGAAQYGPSGECQNTPLLRQVAGQFSGKAAPQSDARLCAIAETLLASSAKGSLDESTMRFLSSYNGLPSWPFQSSAADFQTEDMKLIAERLAPPLTSFAQSATQPRFGLAMKRGTAGKTRIALVMQDQPVEVSAVPRRLEANAHATLSGKIVGSASNAKVLVSDPLGKLQTVPVGSDGSFSVPLSCGDKPGRIVVEVRADQKGGSAPLANFPIACASDLPATAPAASAAGTVDAAAEAKKLLELVNADRTAAGLPALMWDEAVAGVARAEAEAFRDEALGGQGKPDVVGRLKQAGVATTVVLENPAAARTAEEAHTRLGASPVNRSNDLSSDATHAGIGFVAATVNGQPSGFVTEIFVKEQAAANMDTARSQLGAALAQKRKDARAPAFVKDPFLEEVAQKYATALAAAGGKLPKDQADALLAPLNRRYRTVNVLEGAKPNPVDFAEEPGVVGKGNQLGFGLALGTSSVLGKNAVFVTILTASKK